MIYNSLILIEQSIKDVIETKLGSTGLLYRIHSRIKDKESISEKIERKDYKNNGKLLQDVIGIRIMTYFTEDINIISSYFSSIFNVVSYEHDSLKVNQFNPVRLNLVCKMEGQYLKEFEAWKNRYEESFKHIDSTFEIQIRTTLSEGWHEIEHTMRYKCKSEWESLESESRFLNGIHATLETSDMTLFNLFDEIAYQHYKNKNWMGMLRNKFRLRLEMEPLSNDLVCLLDNNPDLAKQLYKIERSDIIYQLMQNELNLHITFNNIVFLSNYLSINNSDIANLTPTEIIAEFGKIPKEDNLM